MLCDSLNDDGGHGDTEQGGSRPAPAGLRMRFLTSLLFPTWTGSPQLHGFLAPPPPGRTENFHGDRNWASGEFSLNI